MSAKKKTSNQPYNERLKALREATPSPDDPTVAMTRDELADAANAYLRIHHPEDTHGVDGREIGKYERGVLRWPSEGRRDAIRFVLSQGRAIPLTYAELGFFHFWTRKRAPVIPEPGLLGGAAPDQAGDRPGEADRPKVVTRLRPTGHTLESTGVGAGAPLPGDPQEALVTASDESFELLQWLERTQVGGHTVDQLHSDLRRVTLNYLQVPTMKLWSHTVEIRDRATTLLARSGAPSRTRELYSAAGWSLIVLAWMSVDLGHPELAEDHARAAWVCAERADQNSLRAWVRATQHTAAYWQSDYLTAADYAQEGLTLSGIGTARPFLSSALALDLARAGKLGEARGALALAQAAADDVIPVADEFGGPFGCPVERSRSVWGDAELALGIAGGALDSADRAVTAFESAPVINRNHGSERMARLLQALAHLKLGDPAAAHAALTPVLVTPAEHRMRPLMARLDQIDTVAAAMPGQADPLILRLREDITAFHHEPGRGGAVPV